MVYPLDKTNKSAIYTWIRKIERDPAISYTDVMETVFDFFDISAYPKRHYLWELAYSYGYGFGWIEII